MYTCLFLYTYNICFYVYMDICIYIYILCIYLCLHIYMYIYVYILYMYLNKYVYIDMVYIYIYMHCYCKYAALCRHGLPLIRHTPRDDFQSRIVPTDCLEYLVWVYELHGLTWLVLYPNIAGRSVVLTIPK